MSHMRSCIAGVSPDNVPLLTAALEGVGFPLPTVFGRLNVTEIGLNIPDVLVVDLDATDIDAMEMLRLVRFVLRTCVIAAYTNRSSRSWALESHLAGAHCILSKANDEAHLVAGLSHAFKTGCFPDPSIVAA